jgi:hypothetical protein
MFYESFTDASTTNAQCTSTGSATTNFKTSLTTYLEQCKNGGQYPEAVTQFFQQTLNIPSQFETMSAVYTDLNTTLTNVISNNGALSFVEKIDNALDIINEKENELKTMKTKLEKNAERNDRRFVEEKIIAGETESSDKLRTFQDKVVGALFFSYIFLAISIIAVTARNSQYNYKVIAVSALIFLFISSVLYALFKHFA